VKPKHLVEIRCDGGPQVGFGHIRRCITLKERLEKDGYSVNLLGMSIESQNFLDAFLPFNCNTDKSSDLIILDGATREMDEYLLEAKARGIESIVLDYFGGAEADYNVLIYPHYQYKAKKNSFIGYQYVMIRDEILAVKQERPIRNSRNSFVLVAIGGGDILGQGHLVSKYLAELGLNIVLAAGPLRNCIDIEMPLPYTVSKNQLDFPRLFSQCDWVVTNGGGTLFEALYLNKSIFVLPQTKAEERIALDMFSKQLVMGVGLENLHPKLKNRSNNFNSGDKVIDGHGSSRVSKIVSNILRDNA
jgi:spore coat polysaccharide biosynthesis predicted glycosyltransferase SpsG